MSKNHSIILNIVVGLQSHYPDMNPDDTLARTHEIVASIDDLATFLDRAEESDGPIVAPESVDGPAVTGDLTEDPAAPARDAFAKAFPDPAATAVAPAAPYAGQGGVTPPTSAGSFPLPTPTPPGIKGA